LIAKVDGGAFNHIEDMSNATVGFMKDLKSLEGSLRNPNLHPEVRTFLELKANEAKVVLAKMNKALE
jgi:hypothetical protein